MPGRSRCKYHGGNSYGGYRGGTIVPMRKAMVARQALFKALGLPWYGGRPPKKASRVLANMDKALMVAETLLAEVEAMPAAKGTAAAVLDAATVDSLRMQHDIVLLSRPQVDAMREAQAAGEVVPIDYKLLRISNEAARDLNRLSVRVAEGQFRARRDDVLVRLLEQLSAAEKKADPTA